MTTKRSRSAPTSAVRPVPAPSATLGRLAGLATSLVALIAYWLSAREFDAGRGDLFLLADAFLHGRTDIARQLGPYDVILMDGRIYVPFAPFPAFLLMPLVGLVGPTVADQWESGINAGLAALCVGLAWWVTSRIGVQRLRDRLGLVILLGFSTPIWWVTTRGGVWHTGHLVATLLLLIVLAELWGWRRPFVFGLLLGAAFLTRPPVALAAPVLGLSLASDHALERRRSLVERLRLLPWRGWVALAVGFLPALAFFLAYNAIRFGSPTESGYALATLPNWLAELRGRGLFSPVHIPMNLDYLLFHLPRRIGEFPWFQPDGLGLSVFLTSPGLLLGAFAPWREDRRTWVLLGAGTAVLLPTLLYYGGGWLQFGYRYFLDSVPFVWALCVMAAARRGHLGHLWWIAIGFGVTVNAAGVYWAYNL